MINYPKIQSLFKRDPNTNYATFLDEYSMPEFEYLKDCQWEWVEKIDGTNIKIYFEPEGEIVLGKSFSIGGRTEKAQLPCFLTDYLITILASKKELFHTTFDCPVTLYGEGYGPKINNGHKYRDDVSFILFDIRIGDIWLKRKDVVEIGAHLGIDVAPTVFMGTCEEALISMRADSFPSILNIADTVLETTKKDCEAEGLVGQPVVPILTRLGKRIITKLKTEDFKND